MQLVSVTTLTPQADALFHGLHIDANASTGQQLAEFRARITYLTFSSDAYIRKLLNELHHLSVLDASLTGLQVPPHPHASSLALHVTSIRGVAASLPDGSALVMLSIKG